MSAWGGVGVDGGGVDFMSLYMSKTHTPNHKMNGHFSELAFSPSPTKAPAADPHAFCHRENVDQCILYLDQEVTSLGMPSLYDGASPTYDIVRIANCLHDLLQRHQRSARVREEQECRIHRLESDESHSRLQQGRLKASLEDTERKKAMIEEQVRQATNKNKLLTTKLKAEKEEVRRLQSEGQHRYAQFKHDLNKKEREMTKLKERLNQLLSDKCQEKKIGMEMSEIIQRTDGKRGTWQKKNRQDEELHREVIVNYEHRQKELMVENEGLRQCLSTCVGTLQKELDTLVKDSSISIHHTDLWDSDDDISVESDNNSELIDAHFEMPCDFIRENLEKNMQEKCRKLRKVFKRVAKGDGDSVPSSVVEPVPALNDGKYQKELERLHKQNERYREIIEQQEQLIQQSLATVTQSPTDATRVGGGPDALEDMETLNAERKLFTQQKAHFDNERRSYNEAAVRLSRENSEEEDANDEPKLEAIARELFEKERASYLAQQILQMTPFNTASSSKLRPHSPDKSHLTPGIAGPDKSHLSPGIAAFSPAPNSNANLAPPSTADLYRFLGLTPREARNQQASSFASPALKRSGTQNHPISPVADLSPQQSAVSSPSHQSRISEHAHNVKMAVFNREVTSPEGPRSPLS